MMHPTQGLPLCPLNNAFDAEVETFVKTVQHIHVTDVPKDASRITSHVIYKVKINVDGSKKMKARIAPHGNKDKDIHTLKLIPPHALQPEYAPYSPLPQYSSGLWQKSNSRALSYRQDKHSVKFTLFPRVNIQIGLLIGHSSLQHMVL